MRQRKTGMTPESLLISVDECAALLSIGKSLAWELVQQGKIPSVKLGGRRLVVRRGLENLIDDRTLGQ